MMIFSIRGLVTEHGTDDFQESVFDVIKNQHLGFSVLDFPMVVLFKSVIMLHERSGREMKQLSHAGWSEPGGSGPLIERGSAGSLVWANAKVIGQRSRVKRLLLIFDHNEHISGQKQIDARDRIEQLFGAFERRMVGQCLTDLLFNRSHGFGQMFDLLLKDHHHTGMGRRSFFYRAEPIGELGPVFNEEFPSSEHRIEFGEDGFPRLPERHFVPMASKIIGNVVTIVRIAFRLRAPARGGDARGIDHRNAIALRPQMQAQAFAEDARRLHGDHGRTTNGATLMQPLQKGPKAVRRLLERWRRVLRASLAVQKGHGEGTVGQIDADAVAGYGWKCGHECYG